MTTTVDTLQHRAHSPHAKPLKAHRKNHAKHTEHHAPSPRQTYNAKSDSKSTFQTARSPTTFKHPIHSQTPLQPKPSPLAQLMALSTPVKVLLGSLATGVVVGTAVFAARSLSTSGAVVPQEFQQPLTAKVKQMATHAMEDVSEKGEKKVKGVGGKSSGSSSYRAYVAPSSSSTASPATPSPKSPSTFGKNRFLLFGIVPLLTLVAFPLDFVLARVILNDAKLLPIKYELMNTLNNLGFTLDTSATSFEDNTQASIPLLGDQASLHTTQPPPTQDTALRTSPSLSAGNRVPHAAPMPSGTTSQPSATSQNTGGGKQNPEFLSTLGGRIEDLYKAFQAHRDDIQLLRNLPRNITNEQLSQLQTKYLPSNNPLNHPQNITEYRKAVDAQLLKEFIKEGIMISIIEDNPQLPKFDRIKHFVNSDDSLVALLKITLHFNSTPEAIESLSDSQIKDLLDLLNSVPYKKANEGKPIQVSMPDPKVVYPPTAKEVSMLNVNRRRQLRVSNPYARTFDSLTPKGLSPLHNDDLSPKPKGLSPKPKGLSSLHSDDFVGLLLQEAERRDMKIDPIHIN